MLDLFWRFLALLLGDFILKFAFLFFRAPLFVYLEGYTTRFGSFFGRVSPRWWPCRAAAVLSKGSLTFGTYPAEILQVIVTPTAPG